MMTTWITNNFDIDLWIKLAGEQPFKFEQQRQQWLEHSIISASPDLQPRLKGLHWEINMDLEIARNKYKSCNLIADRLVEHLTTFKEILAGTASMYMNHNHQSATILNFVQPRSTD
jgi:hypothetical protein